LKKKFVTNLILLLFLNILVKPFWVFGIDRTVQNVVGAADYGIYFSLFSFSILLNILLDFGMTNFNNREISRHPSAIKSMFSSMVGLKFVMAIFYALVCLAIGWIIGYDRQQFSLLWFLILNQFLASLILYFRSNISGLQLFRTDSLLSVLDKTLMIVICSMLLWGRATGGDFQIEWFVYAQTASYAIAALIAFILVYIRAGKFIALPEPRLFLTIIRNSYPFALLSILMAIYYRIDSVMLERMLPDGAVQAGIYAQAFRILDAFTMYAFLFASLLLPMFSRMIQQNKKVEDLTIFSLMLLLVPVIAVSLILVFYRLEFMNVLYHEHAAESAEVLALLMLAHIFVSATYIFGTLLTAGGFLKELNITASVGLVMNVILNVILIPRHQAFGSALASLVTQVVILAIQVALVFRIFHFRLDANLLIRFGFFILFLCAANWSSIFMDLPWWLEVGGIFFFTIGLAFLTGLVRLRVLMQLLTSEES
jgi:O-antigen/teichoic acid export membrane protein